MSEKTKSNIAGFIVSMILIGYGFLLGWIGRENLYVTEKCKEYKKEEEKLNKIRKDGFFVNKDEF